MVDKVDIKTLSSEVKNCIWSNRATSFIQDGKAHVLTYNKADLSHSQFAMAKNNIMEYGNVELAKQAVQQIGKKYSSVETKSGEVPGGATFKSIYLVIDEAVYKQILNDIAKEKKKGASIDNLKHAANLANASGLIEKLNSNLSHAQELQQAGYGLPTQAKGNFLS